MSDFHRNGRGGRRFGAGRDFGRREMHKAICAKCGKECEVPFRPSGDRPVYCNDCFDRRENSGGRSDFAPRRQFSGGNRGDNSQLADQLKNLNFKLDKIISILEPKPVVPPANIDIADIIAEPKEEKPKVSKKIAKTKKEVKEEKV